MAKRTAVPSRELELFIVGPKESFKASRIQRIGFNTDIPSTINDEIGSATHAGTTKDPANVTVTFSAFDVGVKIFSVLTGTDYTAYPGAGVDILSLGEMDAILEIKSATAATYAKSGHARRLQIRDFAFNYTVDGDSTEDYTAVGSARRWLKYDVIVDKFTSGTTSFTLTQTPIQLLNGDRALSVVLDGAYLTEVAGAPATGEYRVVGTTLTTGDSRTSQVLAIYHANASSAWADVSDDTMPSAIRGKNIPIKISANSIPRVQSVTINGTLNVQPVREMGNVDVVGYQRQVPDVTGSLTVLDTDTDLISLLTTGTLGSGYEWQPGEGCAVANVDLEVILLDPCDTDSVLKTVYIPALDITSEAYTSNVNQNTSVTFNWRSRTAQCIVYSGAKP